MGCALLECLRRDMLSLISVQCFCSDESLEIRTNIFFSLRGNYELTFISKENVLA